VLSLSVVHNVRLRVHCYRGVCRSWLFLNNLGNDEHGCGTQGVPLCPQTMPSRLMLVAVGVLGICLVLRMYLSGRCIVLMMVVGVDVVVRCLDGKENSHNPRHKQ